MANEFEIAVEDASELADSFETLEGVEDQIRAPALNWSEDAEIHVYLVRRTDSGGLGGADQWPVGVPVWLVDVNSAGVPRGAGFGIDDQVGFGFDAKTGESLTEFQAAPQGR